MRLWRSIALPLTPWEFSGWFSAILLVAAATLAFMFCLPALAAAVPLCR